MRGGMFIAGVIFTLTTSVFAASTINQVESDLSTTQQQQQKLEAEAKTISSNLEELRENVLNKAKELQAKQLELLDTEDELESLESKHDALLKELEKNHEAMSEMISVLVRLSMLPPDALIASPKNPDETIRSMILLQSTVPNLKLQADGLKEKLDALAATTTAIEEKRETITKMTASLEDEKQSLEKIVAGKSKLLRTVESDRLAAAARAKELAKQSADLQDLMGRLAMRSKPDAPITKPSSPSKPSAKIAEKETETQPHRSDFPSFTKARGHILMPVEGKIIKDFGDPTDAGTSRGISILPTKSAQVLAPYDGEIVYAGPFRTYGQLLIIEHSEGYHILLAGFSKTERGVGDTVLAGEPVGLTGVAKGRAVPLYLELRSNGKAIDPKPWLSRKR